MTAVAPALGYSEGSVEGRRSVGAVPVGSGPQLSGSVAAVSMNPGQVLKMPAVALSEKSLAAGSVNPGSVLYTPMQPI